MGTLEFNVEATHTTLALSNATGASESRSEGTIANPEWRARFDLRYSKGPFRAFYQMYYLPSALRTVNATVENDPMPQISGNTRHQVSIQYTFPNLTPPAGAHNQPTTRP